MVAEPVHIRPIIRELVRTQVCFPDIRLLVDRIIVLGLPSSNEAENQQAYRLFLTDREKTIQAVVRRRLHRTINNGKIREGSFVVLKDYCLARAKRTNCEGEVIYLQVADFYSIGEEAREYGGSSATLLLASDGNDARSPHHIISIPDTASRPVERKRDPALSELASNPLKRGRGREHPAAELDTEAGSVFPTECDILDDTALEAKRPHFDPDKDVVRSNEESTYHAAYELYIASNAGLPASDMAANDLKPITRPLKLSTLASVTGAKRSKNEIHDVFALIVHVDAHTYKPLRMPRKRDLRIMDSSTGKRVVLSVFTDPIAFKPKSGTLALFRNLTTHDWDGGNLKAYPWLCESRAWFVPVPDDGLLEGIERKDVEELRVLRDGMTSSRALDVESA